jgi:hypothetical protein
MASYLHRTAQPSTLATFRSWGSSTGAGRIRLAAAKIQRKFLVLNLKQILPKKLIPDRILCVPRIKICDPYQLIRPIRK